MARAGPPAARRTGWDERPSALEAARTMVGSGSAGRVRLRGGIGNTAVAKQLTGQRLAGEEHLGGIGLGGGCLACRSSQPGATPVPARPVRSSLAALGPVLPSLRDGLRPAFPVRGPRLSVLSDGGHAREARLGPAVRRDPQVSLEGARRGRGLPVCPQPQGGNDDSNPWRPFCDALADLAEVTSGPSPRLFDVWHSLRAGTGRDCRLVLRDRIEFD